VTRAGIKVAPRALKHAHTLAVRDAPGRRVGRVDQTFSRSARESTDWLSWIECVRARDLGVTNRSG